jgi:hypothetical protein
MSLSPWWGVVGRLGLEPGKCRTSGPVASVCRFATPHGGDHVRIRPVTRSSAYRLPSAQCAEARPDSPPCKAVVPRTVQVGMGAGFISFDRRLPLATIQAHPRAGPIRTDSLLLRGAVYPSPAFSTPGSSTGGRPLPVARFTAVTLSRHQRIPTCRAYSRPAPLAGVPAPSSPQGRRLGASFEVPQCRTWYRSRIRTGLRGFGPRVHPKHFIRWAREPCRRGPADPLRRAPPPFTSTTTANHARVGAPRDPPGT